ncbi:MAG TPA: hypothetical protein VME69_12885, partial [Methylocella sp.]|nr:hypothetical protein [Methylocella sp.]
MQQQMTRQSLQAATVPAQPKAELSCEPPCFDEMTLSDGRIRPVYGKVANWLSSTPASLLAARR